MPTLPYGHQHYITRRVCPFVYASEIAPEIIVVSEKTIFFPRLIKSARCGPKVELCRRAINRAQGASFAGRKDPDSPFVFFLLPERQAHGPFTDLRAAALRECDRSGSRVSCLHFSLSSRARRTNLPVKYHENRMY